MLTAKPFQDLIALIEAVAGQAPATDTVQNTLESDDKSLGKKGFISWAGLRDRVADLQGKCSPRLSQIHICVFASSYEKYGSKEISLQFVEKAKSGDAAVNRLCVPHGLGLRVFELAPDTPHVLEPLWTEAGCMQAVAFGMEVAASEGDVLGLAAIAPGSNIQAKALIDALKLQGRPQNSGEELDHKAVQADTLEQVRNFAGREIAALIGGILAAKSQNMVVMIEDWAGLAAAAALHNIQPGFCSHVFSSAAVDKDYETICEKLHIPVLMSVSGEAESGCSLAIGLSLMASAASI